MNHGYSEYPICRHIKTNGRRCGSPALTTSAFCHFHQKARRSRMRTLSAGTGLSTNVVHPLRNAQSMQQAISMVLNGLASGRIHPKVANRMLHALSIAAANLYKDQ